MIKIPELNRTSFNRYTAATAALAGLLSVSASVANADVIVTSGEVVGRSVHPPRDHTEMRQRLGGVVCRDTGDGDKECGSAVQKISVIVHEGATYTLTLRDCDIAEQPGVCVEGDVNVSQQVFEHARLGANYAPNAAQT